MTLVTSKDLYPSKAPLYFNGLVTGVAAAVLSPVTANFAFDSRAKLEVFWVVGATSMFVEDGAMVARETNKVLSLDYSSRFCLWYLVRIYLFLLLKVRFNSFFVLIMRTLKWEGICRGSCHTWFILFLVMNFRDAIVSSVQALGENVDIQSTFVYPGNLLILAHISLITITIASDYQITGFVIFMWRF
jgi:hypothetical protein